MEQLNSSRCLDTADYLTHLRRFPVNLKIPICFAAAVNKGWYVLP